MRSLGSTVSPTTTARELKEDNLRRLRFEPRFTLHEADLADRRSRPAGRGRRSGLPPGGAAGGAGELGDELRHLHHEQCAGDPTAARSGQRIAAAEIRLRVVLIGLRRRRSVPDWRDAAAEAGLALRRDQAERRAIGLSLLAQLWRPNRLAALLHRLRPAPAPGHGLRALHPRDPGRPPDRNFW